MYMQGRDQRQIKFNGDQAHRKEKQASYYFMNMTKIVEDEAKKIHESFQSLYLNNQQIQWDVEVQ